MNNYLYSQLIHPNLDNKETFLLLDDGKSFSYEEIISIASKISHKLIKFGLKVGDPLLVKAPKCKETIALYLSSIMTGAVYFPLNSNYTPLSSLGEILNISWITPQLCVLILSSMNEKRRFIDRLTMSIDSLHLNRVYKYDKLFRQRNKIIMQPNSDEKWLETVESQISELSVSIIARD